MMNSSGLKGLLDGNAALSDEIMEFSVVLWLLAANDNGRVLLEVLKRVLWWVFDIVRWWWQQWREWWLLPVKRAEVNLSNKTDWWLMVKLESGSGDEFWMEDGIAVVVVKWLSRWWNWWWWTWFWNITTGKRVWGTEEKKLENPEKFRKLQFNLRWDIQTVYNFKETHGAVFHP